MSFGLRDTGNVFIGGATPANAGVAAGGLSSLLGAAGPIGGLVGAGLSFLGGIQANKASAREADKNRQFQERMRATQYQTAVADLKAAGLNPMLAYTQGGAGNLAGAQGSPRDAATPAVSSAAMVANAMASIGNTIADTKNKEAQTGNINADTALKLSAEELNHSYKYLTRAQTSSARTAAEVSHATEQAAIDRIRAELRLKQLEIPEREAQANFYKSLPGEFSKFLGPIKVISDILRR